MIVSETIPGVLYRHIYSEIFLPFSTDLVLIGLQRQDLSIAGVVAYNTWLEDSCFMHVAFGSHAVSRQMLSEAFRYPFVTCGKSRVYGLTPITSERALRFSQRLGFRPVVDNEDFRLQVMTREECRWINDDSARPDATSCGMARAANAADRIPNATVCTI